MCCGENMSQTVCPLTSGTVASFWHETIHCGPGYLQHTLFLIIWVKASHVALAAGKDHARTPLVKCLSWLSRTHFQEFYFHLDILRCTRLIASRENCLFACEIYVSWPSGANLIKPALHPYECHVMMMMNLAIYTSRLSHMKVKVTQSWKDMIIQAKT